MLRLHLPPNLAAAAARNAIPLKVELNLAALPSEALAKEGGEPPPDLLPALALLQRWCGVPSEALAKEGPQPPFFLQLPRAQLRALAAAVDEQPLFVENGQPVRWHHDELVVDPIAPAPAVIGNPNPKIQKQKTSAAPLVVDGSEHFLAFTLPSREHPCYPDVLALVKE